MDFCMKGFVFTPESISWGIFDLCNGNIYIYLIKCIFDIFYVILKFNQLLDCYRKIWSTSTTLHCKCGTEAASWLALCIRKSRSNILVAWKTKRLLKMGVNYKKWAKNIPKSLKWPVTCAFEKKNPVIINEAVYTAQRLSYLHHIFMMREFVRAQNFAVSVKFFTGDYSKRLCLTIAFIHSTEIYWF